MHHRVLVLIILSSVAFAACGDDDSGAPDSTAAAPVTATEASTPDSSPDAASAEGSSTVAEVPSDPCELLTEADFTAAGVSLDGPGADVSENFSLATDSSSACQWTSFANSIGASWELIVGRGQAQPAFDSDREPASSDDTTADLALGDSAYFIDEVSSSDVADHDFKAGVLIGDLYFRLSTTADDGADAIRALAGVVAERLGGAASSG